MSYPHGFHPFTSMFNRFHPFGLGTQSHHQQAAPQPLVYVLVPMLQNPFPFHPTAVTPIYPSHQLTQLGCPVFVPPASSDQFSYGPASGSNSNPIVADSITYNQPFERFSAPLQTVAQEPKSEEPNQPPNQSRDTSHTSSSAAAKRTSGNSSSGALGRKKGPKSEKREEIKAAVLQEYWAHKNNPSTPGTPFLIAEAAKRHDVHRDTIQRWLNTADPDRESRRKNQQKHTKELFTEAYLNGELEFLSLEKISEKFQINPSTVNRWKPEAETRKKQHMASKATNPFQLPTPLATENANQNSSSSSAAAAAHSATSMDGRGS